VLTITAVLLILSASLFGIYIHTKSNAVIAHMAGVYKDKGIMSAESYHRLANIQTTIFRTGKISDADLHWAILLLQSKPLVESRSNENSLHRAILLYLSGIRSLSQAQKNEFFLALVPFASDKDLYVKGMAATTFGEVGDTRALPYLQKMQSDQDSQVRANSTRSLRRLM
jgi:HEAT repeat protein